jgi:hypothetical protein
MGYVDSWLASSIDRNRHNGGDGYIVRPRQVVQGTGCLNARVGAENETCAQELRRALQSAWKPVELELEPVLITLPVQRRNRRSGVPA